MQNFFVIASELLGALGLLIYGMKMMSESLQKIAGPQLRHILGKMTTNRFMGILTGTLVTSAVQSSSATTVMTVSFVSAGLLTLGQAISVIMGANIGTTLTAWIMSLGYNVNLMMVVFPAFFIGMLLIYSKSKRNIGDFVFGIAFMFLSLVMLSTAGKEMDLEHNPSVVEFFASFDTSSHFTIIIFLLIGTIITCLVQSSAAVMAITILLCSTGVLPIYLGIALVMGENIGTTATANLVALGANTQARRAAMAHLLFNVFGVIWVLCLFYPFVDIVCGIVGYDPKQSGQATLLPVVLAMFHTCFNVINTTLLIGFVKYIEKAVCFILPQKNDDKNEFKLRYIKANLVQTPEIAVLQAQKETAYFGERVYNMFLLTRKLLFDVERKDAETFLENIKKEEDFTDNTETELAKFLEKVSDDHLSTDSKMKIRQMRRAINELESIGDSCYSLAASYVKSADGDTLNQFSEKQNAGLLRMMDLCDNALNRMNLVLGGRREDYSIEVTYRIEKQIDELRGNLKEENIQSIEKNEYKYSVGTLYADIIDELEHLGDYVVNVVQSKLATA